MRGARVLALPVVATGVLAARLLLLPFHLKSVVGGAFRGEAAEICWGATAVALGVAIGAGMTLLLR
jgi:hypothetical protein